MRKRTALFENNGNDKMPIRHQNEINMAKTSMIVIFSYFICWLPFTVLITSGLFSNEAEVFLRSTFSNFGLSTAKLLAYVPGALLPSLNSVIDPFIYAYRLQEVRKAMRKFFCCGL